MVLAVAGCLWAPIVASAGSVFTYIQMFWGFISPGIVAVFAAGLIWPKVPQKAAVGTMILGVPVYGLLLWLLPEVAFLHHMGLTFLVLVAYIIVVTLVSPLQQAAVLPEPQDFDLTPTPEIRWIGGAIVLATVVLYVVFR